MDGTGVPVVKKETESAGGYIMAASDHFFEGDPENIRQYVEIARGFRY